jgi:hypothetical protein
MLQQKLQLIQRLQQKYPDLHVGGSLGLMLLGFNLNRDMSISDIDLVKKVDDGRLTKRQSWTYDNARHDFHYRLEQNGITYDIRIDDEQKCTEVVFDGVVYKVSTLETILLYKKIYAEKGVEKHIKDLELINQQLIQFHHDQSTANH